MTKIYRKMVLELFLFWFLFLKLIAKKIGDEKIVGRCEEAIKEFKKFKFELFK